MGIWHLHIKKTPYLLKVSKKKEIKFLEIDQLFGGWGGRHDMGWKEHAI